MVRRITKIGKAVVLGVARAAIRACVLTGLPVVAVSATSLAADVCNGHYVPPDARGHGKITFEKGAPIGWTVLDYIADPETGCAKVVCRKGVAPTGDDVDLDFFEFNGEMYKLIGGEVTLRKDGFEVTPKRARRMVIFSTPSAFPVLRTSQLYRFNHWREDKMSGRDTLQPLAYLQRLKAQNETCADLPVPDLRPAKNSPAE